MDEERMSDIDQTIDRYIRSSASKKDFEDIYHWINGNPEKAKQLFKEKDLWDASRLGEHIPIEDEINQWINLKDKISTTRTISISRFVFLKYAAIILMAIGVGWMSNYLFSSLELSSQQIELKQIKATKGQIKEIFLADGTHIWLNSDSKLSFPARFTADNRQVELQGEAFFKVTANEEKPFLVKTKNHSVKVTGTQFNICEYPESKIIETTLVEGKVKILSGNIFKDLLPGQQSSFNTKTSKIRISEKDFEIYTSWKDGKYEFKNEPIGKVFQIVERWWDLKINCSDKKIENVRISGVLKRHKPVEQLFVLIEQLVPIEYNIEDNKINVISK